MANISPVKHLTDYDHYANVIVFRYEDDAQTLYFDCEFTDETPKVIQGGVVTVPPKYSVLVSRIGKFAPASPSVRGVPDIEKVKLGIRKYFELHPLGLSKSPPEKVLFK